MKIFGLVGKKQVGKDSFARFVKELLPDKKVQKVAIARALKQFCIDYLGLPSESCWGSEKDKTRPVNTWGKVFDKSVLDMLDKAHDDLISGRDILQVVGTNIFRQNFTGDFWINVCCEDLKRFENEGVDVALVTDVRFPNEFERLNSMGAKMIRIYRDLPNIDEHASETSMDNFPDNRMHHIIDKEQNINLKTLKNRTRWILEFEKLIDSPMGLEVEM